MKIISVYLLILFSVLSAFADTDVDLSRDISATAKGNNISLGYSLETLTDSETEIVGMSHHWQYDFSNNTTNINLNSSLPDFEINSLTHRFGYELTIIEMVSVALNYSTTDFNSGEARESLFSSGLALKLGNFKIGYVASNADIFQTSEVLITPGNDRKDDIKFNRKSSSYSLSVNVTDTLVTGINYTEYKYDKNLDISYVFMTTPAVLNRAGGAIANEVGSQLKNSVDLNLLYILSDHWLLRGGLGSSESYLAPSSKSNNGAFGFDYEFNQDKINYRFFALLDIGKTVAIEGTSNSGQLGVGLTF